MPHQCGHLCMHSAQLSASAEAKIGFVLPWIQVRLVPSQHQGDALNDLRAYIKQYISSFIFLGAAYQLNPISLPHSSLKHVHKHTWFATASLQAVKRNHSDTFILLHASNMKLSQSTLCSEPSEIRSCGWGCGHLQEHWASKARPAPVYELQGQGAKSAWHRGNIFGALEGTLRSGLSSNLQAPLRPAWP